MRVAGIASGPHFGMVLLFVVAVLPEVPVLLEVPVVVGILLPILLEGVERACGGGGGGCPSTSL